ncbi:MAG: hypothetical protein A2Y82_01545 [Candidatus Buchananbacteria bacterium RBG_13_36_9]|uniref:Uncharacterized protein n=1 Tax=Candidatus Buchananbacteria bacterium RBG_13_36_9 TaxID=1797530 RepID=A0A1G1XLW9_9BACT|nr:MAG: hypothetical protein A2Y82_01545 [Candidatus Buchananbacteria bacterium RBG_13_36_9]
MKLRNKYNLKYMNKTIIYLLLVSYFVISVAGLALTYFSYPFNFNYTEKLFFYATFAGLLGSTVYMTRGFYQNIVDPNKNFDANTWIWWYLCRPILGLVIGAASFFIAYLALDLEQTFKNQMAILLFGFIAGFNFHEFMEKRIEKKTSITE